MQDYFSFYCSATDKKQLVIERDWKRSGVKLQFVAIDKIKTNLVKFICQHWYGTLSAKFVLL